MLEARERVHSLVDDAFIALTSSTKSQKTEDQTPGTQDFIYEEPMTMKDTKLDQSEHRMDVSHEGEFQLLVSFLSRRYRSLADHCFIYSA